MGIEVKPLLNQEVVLLQDRFAVEDCSLTSNCHWICRGTGKVHHICWKYQLQYFLCWSNLALAACRLYYCSAIYWGLDLKNIWKLPLVENARLLNWSTGICEAYSKRPVLVDY